MNRVNNNYYVYLYALIAAIKIIFSALLLAYYPSSFFAPDTYSYVFPAQKIWSTMSFVNESGPEVFRTPGYSIFLSLSTMLDIPMLQYVTSVNLLIIFFSAYAANKITFVVSNNKLASHVAAFMVLLSPDILLSQHQILSELLFTAFLISSVWLFIVWHRSENTIYLIAAFLLLTLATFVRPTALYLPFLIAGLILFYLFFSDSLHRKLTVFIFVLVALGIHISAVEAWKDRNLRVAGTHEFSIAKSVILNEYIAAAIDARGSRRDWYEIQKEYRNGYEALPVLDRERFVSKKLLENIQKYPYESTRIFLNGVFTNAMDAGFGEWLNFFGLRSQGSGIIYKYNNLSLPDFLVFLVDNEKLLLLSSFLGLLYMGAVWLGAFFALNRLRLSFPILLIVSVISYVLIISAGPQSLARFRVPVMPLILIFSAIGISMVYVKIREKLFVS